MKDQREPLLKLQTAGYISFIREFTEQVAIMRKYFYVVVPYEEATLSASKGFLGGLLGGKKDDGNSKQKTEDINFEEKRSQLDERVNVISGGLESCGARTERLETEAVIELFYKTFNPGDIQPAIKLGMGGAVQQ